MSRGGLKKVFTVARKKGGGAHGGGHGWFVTFADLMGLMMSFFVMIAAFSTQDQKKMQLVAGSMREAFGSQTVFRTTGVIETDGTPVRPYLKNVERVGPDQAADTTAPVREARKDDGAGSFSADRGFQQAAVSLRQALQDLPEIAELSKNVIVEETPEGLEILVVDQDGRSMFPEGSSFPYERTRKVIEALAPTLRKLPNRVRVTGHTSATQGAARTRGYGWNLSASRALAVRDILAANGLGDDRFESVIGRADSQPMFPDNPFVAPNRRVSILLAREAPPVPASFKP